MATALPTAAVWFEPEGYAVTGERLMGRHAAGHGFLQGLIRHHRTDRFAAVVASDTAGGRFEAMVRAGGRKEPVALLSRADPLALAQVGALFWPGPDFNRLAWSRAGFDPRGWSLTGVTHTTASAGVMDTIADWLTAPLQPWDAVICTSAAVRDTVRTVVEAQAEHLRRRLGAQRFVLPRLPVIPLGVACDELAAHAAQRDSARRQLGLGEEAVAVLFLGRLSFHAKAHPLALYQALAGAVPEGGPEVVLIECGWFANDYIKNAFVAAAAAACPKVRVIRLDGRKPEARSVAWAAADVFASLADNIQETFGLAPLEAMAAGLPVLVSDWDGYRETVRDGIDGFRVPTVMPGPGHAADLAVRHALEADSYDQYIGNVGQLVAVDVEAATDALRRLLTDPELRSRMGAAGQRRAAQAFDWSVVIRRYETLWAELAEERRSAPALVPDPPGQPWPARLDPCLAFASYPTAHLRPETRLGLASADAGGRLAQWRSLAMVNFAASMLPAEAECDDLLARLAAAGELSVAELAAQVSDLHPRKLQRTLAWMLKLGVLRTVPPVPR